VPWPTEETLVELRELYQERERANRVLDRVLSKLSALLMEQDDYKRWATQIGTLEKLPEWIHQVTGGRPLYYSQRPAVQQRRKPKEAREHTISEEYQDRITDKLFRLMQKGGETID